jgi:hypothetical protein
MAVPPRDRISRIACGKRAWGARLSRHWLRLLLLVLGIVAIGLLLTQMIG